MAAALGGLELIAGCATFDPRSAKDARDFDIKAFNSWYRHNRLWNGPNPNVTGRHTVYETYRNCIDKRVTPGVSYSVRWGEVMTAPAPGRIKEYGEITGTGRPGGLYLQIDHGAGYRSSLNHAADPKVNLGEDVERNQPVCVVPREHSMYAKMWLIENFEGVDPDDYGPNHSYMAYFTKPLAIDLETREIKGLVVEKELKQTELIRKLDTARIVREADPLYDKWYNKGGYKPTRWSKARQFKYLETLYEIRPQLFPNISQQDFEAIKKEFYANQPIILTLPFNKPD